MATKVSFTVDRGAERALGDRVMRLKSSKPLPQLTPTLRAIQFLRGVYSRAQIALPAFYLFLGANGEASQACSIEGYSGVVFRHVTKFSSIGAISLACRKAFDHGVRGLTGASFAKCSDQTLMEVANSWTAKSREKSPEDAFAALVLLRTVFRDCSKTDRALFDGTASLGRRVGLLKQYADRAAAHLSLETYELSVLDCAHVVSSLTLIGEIIRSFDDPDTLPNYFDSIDEASLSAAKQLFPEIPDIRLFEKIEIEVNARLCWQWGIERGRHTLLEQLPYATGWF